MLATIWVAISRMFFDKSNLTPSSYARRVAVYLEYIFLSYTQYVSKKTLEQIQSQRFRIIFKSANKSGFLHEKYKEASPKNDTIYIQNINQLPILERNDIEKYFLNELTKPRFSQKRYYKEHTSGSTGQTMEFFEDTITISSRIARYRRQRNWIEGKQSSKLIRIMNRERLGFSNEGVCLTVQDGEDLDSALLRMHKTIEHENKKHPVFLESISSYLLRLAQLINEYNLRHFSVTGLLTFGEVLSVEEKKFIEQIFSAKIFNRYSLREFSTVAQECPHSPPHTFHVISEYFYVEIIDDNDVVLPINRMGKIAITSLINEVMPFIRYNTRDQGRLVSRPCPCGRTLPLLEIKGRDITPLGSLKNDKHTVSSKDIIDVLVSVMYKAGQFQLVHASSSRLDVQVSLFDRYNNEKFFEYIKKSLVKIVGNKPTINIHKVPSIPLSKGGKRVLFIEK